MDIFGYIQDLMIYSQYNFSFDEKTVKVYYLASASFKASKEHEFYQKTINYIGFKVGQKNLFSTEKQVLLDENDINPDDIAKKVRASEKRVSEADVVIADITDMSGGVGFGLALALMEKKPILAFRYKNDKRVLAYGPITSGVHKNVTFKHYETTDDITQYIDKFLEDAKQKIDTKFILIIPAEIDKYLNWASDFRRMHKAQVVRTAIEKEMQKDKDWKNYLKQDSI